MNIINPNFSLLQLPTIALLFISLILQCISRTSYSLIYKHAHYLPAVLLYVNESNVESLLEIRSNSCSWFKMKIATVAQPWPDLNLHLVNLNFLPDMSLQYTFKYPY